MGWVVTSKKVFHGPHMLTFSGVDWVGGVTPVGLVGVRYSSRERGRSGVSLYSWYLILFHLLFVEG